MKTVERMKERTNERRSELLQWHGLLHNEVGGQVTDGLQFICKIDLMHTILAETGHIPRGHAHTSGTICGGGGITANSASGVVPAAECASKPPRAPSPRAPQAPARPPAQLQLRTWHVTHHFVTPHPWYVAS